MLKLIQIDRILYRRRIIINQSGLNWCIIYLYNSWHLFFFSIYNSMHICVLLQNGVQASFLDNIEVYFFCIEVFFSARDRWIKHLNINRRSFCDGWRNERQRKTYIRQHDYFSFVTGFQRIDVKSLLNSIYLMFLSMWFATLSSSAIECATLVNCWKKKDGKISTRFVFKPA